MPCDQLTRDQCGRLRPEPGLELKVDVPAEDLTRLIENGKQSIFENDVHWARFYLAKAKLVGSPKRGLWGLTQEGLNTQLSPDETLALYARVRDANRPGEHFGRGADTRS